MTIDKKIASGFALTLVVLVVIGFLAYQSTTRLIENNRWVAHTHEVVAHLETMLSVLKDAETGQRGYLLTGMDPYLEPYNAAFGQVDALFTQLRKLTEDNPNQQRRLDALRPLVDVKLRELEKTIELRKHQGLDAALAVVKTDEGRKSMDEARRIVREMKEEEDGLAKQRETRAEASAHTTLYTIGIGTVASFLLVAVAGFFITRSITVPIRTAVSQLTSASAEILASTTQQAAGAQEQASAVSETVATVDEVLQTAEQAAQRAKNVGEAVQRTQEIGNSGRKAVEESCAALAAVKERVESTAENILALAEQAQAIG